MNPAKWPRDHQVALLIALVIGAVTGILVGYVIHAVGSGADGSVSFNYWLKRPFRNGGVWWSLLGAAMGGGLIYIRRMTRA
jgi:hypothetical protein